MIGKALKTHKTVKGRVVYDRPPHLWTKKDLKRVLEATKYDNEEMDENFLIELIQELTDSLISAILALIGMGTLGNTVGNILRSITSRLVDVLLPYLPRWENNEEDEKYLF